MKIPKRVECEFTGVDGSYICEIDEKGYGRCGDLIYGWDGVEELCPFITKILEWQEGGDD